MDAQPQTSGVDQAHHFALLGATALPSSRQVVPVLLSLSPFSPVFHVLDIYFFFLSLSL